MQSPQELLTRYLKAVSRKELEVEQLRQELAAEKLFEPEFVFRQLDHNRKGFLCLNDIFQFMQYTLQEHIKHKIGRITFGSNGKNVVKL